MTRRNKKKMPQVEDKLKEQEFDPAPIMPGPTAGGRLGSAVVDQEQEVDGSSTVAGGLKSKTMTIDDLDDEEQQQETKPQVDAFEQPIKKLLRGVSPEVREAIRGTECFARAWFDGEDYCPEEECGLRSLCEGLYDQVVGGVEEELEAQDEMAGLSEEDHKKLAKAANKKAKPSAKAIGKTKSNRKLLKKKKKRKRKGLQHSEPDEKPPWEVEKYKRRPYVAQGRPIDNIVEEFWKCLGSPPSLPDSWRYGKSHTFDDRMVAQQRFMTNYGNGLLITRRSSYHLYYFDGLHLARIWVNAAGGGWIDCHPALAEKLEDEGFDLHQVPAKNKRHVFKFFEHRVWLGTTEQAAVAARLAREVIPHMKVR